MKTPTNQVSSALSMYYEGMSLNAIRRQLEQDHNNYPSDSSVYEWIDKFTQKAVDEAKNYHPNVGDTWVADETVLKMDGRNIWLIDIIDTDTRFLLATKLSTNRSKKDIQTMMESAKERTKKIPKQVLTDGWKGYIDGIELAYGADSKHIVTDPFAGRDNSNTELIERWHGTLKDRTKVMRGFKDIHTAQMILDGWLIHYNYFRPHESLDGKTPAQKAGMKFKYDNWNDVVKSDSPIAVFKEPVREIRVITPEKTVPAFRMSIGKIPKPRMTPHTPRITPKTPRLTSPVFEGHGLISRSPFRGGRKRGRLLR
jgi:putative transposase